MKKKIKITLRGGFHISDEITIHVVRTEQALRAIESYRDRDISVQELIYRVASDWQCARLDNHFCGHRDCMCGGLYRVAREDVEIDA